jgi:hypothetical protein
MQHQPTKPALLQLFFEGFESLFAATINMIATCEASEIHSQPLPTTLANRLCSGILRVFYAHAPEHQRDAAIQRGVIDFMRDYSGSGEDLVTAFTKIAACVAKIAPQLGETWFSTQVAIPLATKTVELGLTASAWGEVVRTLGLEEQGALAALHRAWSSDTLTMLTSKSVTELKKYVYRNRLKVLLELNQEERISAAAELLI